MMKPVPTRKLRRFVLWTILVLAAVYFLKRKIGSNNEEFVTSFVPKYQKLEEIYLKNYKAELYDNPVVVFGKSHSAALKEAQSVLDGFSDRGLRYLVVDPKKAYRDLASKQKNKVVVFTKARMFGDLQYIQALSSTNELETRLYDLGLVRKKSGVGYDNNEVKLDELVTFNELAVLLEGDEGRDEYDRLVELNNDRGKQLNIDKIQLDKHKDGENVKKEAIARSGVNELPIVFFKGVYIGDVKSTLENYQKEILINTNQYKLGKDSFSTMERVADVTKKHRFLIYLTSFDPEYATQKKFFAKYEEGYGAVPHIIDVPTIEDAIEIKKDLNIKTTESQAFPLVLVDGAVVVSGQGYSDLDKSESVLEKLQEKKLVNQGVMKKAELKLKNLLSSYLKEGKFSFVYEEKDEFSKDIVEKVKKDHLVKEWVGTHKIALDVIEYPVMRIILKERYGQSGFPLLFDGTVFYGGRDKIQQLVQNDKLIETLTPKINVLMEADPLKDTDKYLRDLMSASKVLVFSLSYCPHCKNAKKTLEYYMDKYGLVYNVMELDQTKNPPKIKEAVKRLTGHNTFPNILVMGKSIGGNSELQKMHQSGAFLQLLKDNGLVK
ncbi:Glutaredoxin [Zancudomyces culisetae]|uniref:Glutaredoxin n=1 Tax=Zancudomyces culisetae TaxID=1213189 RepID=A0A1R1PJD8_ZANCU|nr:Glutaredoxin [Zancudomyces culisetae]|eukprot:OMH81043.1 Glutaredoxin [Zancudomyces culisetae]